MSFTGDFECRTLARVKRVVHHPRLPVLLLTMHDGTAQMVNFKTRKVYPPFTAHEKEAAVGGGGGGGGGGGPAAAAGGGTRVPCRAADFHPTQNMFATGGDDFKIKVWMYDGGNSNNQKDDDDDDDDENSAVNCCCNAEKFKGFFSLDGHSDYVRNVQFHRDMPWLVSCSDDGTVRIWNFLNRQVLTTVANHYHYVMDCSFHPTRDLVISGSLDQSVRVYNIRALRTYVPPEDPDSLASRVGSWFSSPVEVLCIAEGHTHPVDGVRFNPSRSRDDEFASVSDDLTLRVWKMTAAAATTTTSGGSGGSSSSADSSHNVASSTTSTTKSSSTNCAEILRGRGHSKFLASVDYFGEDFIVTCGEDCTVRMWDTKTRECVQRFQHPGRDRCWNLHVSERWQSLAVGHDHGVMMFKLHDRPTSAAPAAGGGSHNNNRQQNSTTSTTRQQQERVTLDVIRAYDNNAASRAAASSSPKILSAPTDGGGAGGGGDRRAGATATSPVGKNDNDNDDDASSAPLLLNAAEDGSTTAAMPLGNSKKNNPQQQQVIAVTSSASSVDADGTMGTFKTPEEDDAITAAKAAAASAGSGEGEQQGILGAGAAQARGCFSAMSKAFGLSK